MLIAGDQVLPTISPNVGLTPLTPDPNPLATYLQSLERLSALDPDTLVLPSHGRPFVGLAARASEIRQHHERQMAKLFARLSYAADGVRVPAVPVPPQQRGFHLFLAMGEALAHLEYLQPARASSNGGSRSSRHALPAPELADRQRGRSRTAAGPVEQFNGVHHRQGDCRIAAA